MRWIKSTPQSRQLLSALAAVHGARASLADIRLAWDEHCQPEDER